MSNIVPFSDSPASVDTMTSLEIADVTGKQHGHILRDLRDLAEQGVIDLSKFGETSKDSQNRTRTIYRLPKRETLILTSGYSAVQRAAIIDRWLELEESNRKELSPAEQLLAIVQAQVDMERRQKALEAKQAEDEERSKRIEARQEMMEKGFHDFSILAYSRYREYPSLDIKTASALGKTAAKLCRERGFPIGSIRDPRFGTVNTYPEEVLEEVFRCAFVL